MPLLSLESVTLAFGHLPLLDAVTLQVEKGERVCVLGRNGTGKSTLLKVLSGDLAPDSGSQWRAPGLRVARLEQDVPLSSERTVFEVVSEGLGALRELVAEYHRVAARVGAGDAAALGTLGHLQHRLEEQGGWQIEQRIETVLSHLELPANAVVDALSGGWRRRVLLARALVGEPDLLLLDEPTNHLDIAAIEWLERFLAEFAGALVFVTHDRTFLQRLATRIVEIDRGRLTSWPGDYATFLRKKDEWLASETRQDEAFDRKLAGEEAWLRQGVKARRTRNEGRVRALMAMRAERSARRARPGSVRLEVEEAARPGRLVIEAESVTKQYGAVPVVSDLSIRVMRGDRVGLIGPNGAGKTTVLRLLIGDLPPDAGFVRLGANVRVAYYDQQREQLDPDRTVFDTIGDGADTIDVDGRPRHVFAWLRDFLFPEERARSPVKSLSGGERNRLLLARLFTRPANLLVLDEPTNDLDLETLELLEAKLVDWTGTLLLVSHDRAFLDHVVTSTLVVEGNGRLQQYVGGYQDWLRQSAGTPSRGSVQTHATSERAPAKSPVIERQDSLTPARDRRRKLSYKEQRELEELPARIETLEREKGTLQGRVTSPDFYKESAPAIAAAMARLESIDAALTALYDRWDALDSRVT